MSAGAARASGEKAAGVDDCEARLSGEESRVDAAVSVGAVRARGEFFGDFGKNFLRSSRNLTDGMCLLEKSD